MILMDNLSAPRITWEAYLSGEVVGVSILKRLN